MDWVGVYETKSEISHLKSSASYGVGMLRLTALVLVSARLTWRLFWLRRRLHPDGRAVADLINRLQHHVLRRVVA